MEQDRFEITRVFSRPVPKSAYAAFLTSVLVGVLTHLYMLTNKFPNWDDLANIDRYGAWDILGRWLLPETHRLFGRYSTPALNGTAAILLYALTASLIVISLRIRSITCAALTGALLVTFPSLTSNMTFMFTVGDYALAVVIACLGVYLTHRFRFGFVAGIVLLFLSMGIYQAYLPLSAALFLLILVADILDGERAARIVKRGFIFLFTLGASAVWHALYIRTMDLSEYRGMDQVGGATLARLPVTVLRAYHRILQFFVTAPPSYVTREGRSLNLAVLAAAAAFLCVVLYQRRAQISAGRLLMLAAFLLLLPLAASLVYVMAPEVQKASTLMILSYVTVYIVPVLLLSRVRISGGAGAGSKSRGSLMLSLLMFSLLYSVCYGNFKLANEAYFRTGIAFERIENYYSRILVRLEDTEGYRYGDPVEIIGDSWPDPHVLSADMMSGTRFADLEGLAIENGIFTSGSRRFFLRTYFGMETGLNTGEDPYTRLHETQEFRDMPVFPAAGCVKKIDGIWVVKVED